MRIEGPVLFVGAHTDDIELFSGGLAAKLRREGVPTFWLTFSSHRGVTDHMKARDEHLENVHQVGAFLASCCDLGAVNGEFQTHRQYIYDKLLDAIQQYDIKLVVTHPEDTNQDHRQVLDEVRRCCKTRVGFMSGEYPFNQLQGRLPDVFVPLTKEDVDMKVKLIQNYKSQYAPHRHYFDPDVWYGLAKVRGSQIGVPYAEGFFTERLILS